MTARDSQRGRVYAWEDRVIAPLDPSRIEFSNAQGMIEAIWSEMGLRYPPQAAPMPAQARRRIADANRLTVRLPPMTPSWCLLHELAHAMTTTHDGTSEGHGPVFMGVYVGLLTRYLRLDETWLLRSARDDGLQVTPDAKPVFSDP